MNTIHTKMKSLATHPLVKGSVIVLTGAMAANVGAYIYHVMVGRLLGPIVYGEYSALLSLFYLLNIGSGVIQTILTKFFSQLRARKLFFEIPTLFWSSVRLIGIAIAIGFVIIIFASPVLAQFLQIQSHYFIWLYLILASFIFSVVNISVLQSFQLFVASSILTNVGAVLRLVFGVIGASFGLIGVLIANIVSNLLTYILYFIPIWKLLRVKSHPLSIQKSDAVGYSLPTLLATFGTIALYSQDVLLVKHFFSAYEAGIYASLAVLGKIIFYTSAALGYVMFPMIVEKKELKQSHSGMVYSAIFAVAALSSILTVGYFVAPTLIVRLMYGKAFDGAIGYMGIFGIFITFFTIVNIMVTIFLAIGKTRVWLIALGAALAQALGIWFFHTTLYQVIYINIAVSFFACVMLLVYYRHGEK